MLLCNTYHICSLGTSEMLPISPLIEASRNNWRVPSSRSTCVWSTPGMLEARNASSEPAYMCGWCVQAGYKYKVKLEEI